MRLLVTGGCGFIGSEFVRMTLRDHPDDHVVVLDKLTYAGNPRNLDAVRDDPRFRFVKGDITDGRAVGVLAAEVDVIVNFAAETHVDRSLESPGSFIQTDVYGTWVLIEAARTCDHERFVQVSTDEVYGNVPDECSTEDSPLRPRSPYSASKAGAELQVQAYAATYDFPAIITRGSNTYGPRQYPEKIVPLYILNAMEGRPLPLYGDGRAVRDYIHVEDHCRAIDIAMRRGIPGSAYNIGIGVETTGLEIADTILDLLDAPVRSRSSFAIDEAMIAATPSIPGAWLCWGGLRPSICRRVWLLPWRGIRPTPTGGSRSAPTSTGSSTDVTITLSMRVTS